MEKETSLSHHVRDSITISQPIFYGGELEVGYSLHAPRSGIQSLLDSMKATVVSSDTLAFIETINERWRIADFLIDSLFARYRNDSRLNWMQLDRMIRPPVGVTTDITKSPSKIDRYHLSQNYPNPFNPLTTISYSVPETGHVTLKIYDLLGREVTTLVDRRISTGTYSVEWDGSAMPSGIYFYRLQAGSHIIAKKLILMK
jgi:hypothetical protein